MLLRCLSRYQSQDYGPYQPGQVIHDLSPDDAAHLLADSPGSFEVVGSEPEARAVETPPADRMVRKGRTRRAKGEAG